MARQYKQLFSLDTEKAILSSLIYFKDAVYGVCDLLEGSEFYDRKHRLIYEAAIDLMMDDTRIDLTALIDQLSKRGDLEKAGGRAYLSALTDHVASAANIRHHAETVANFHQLRELYMAGKKLQDACISGDPAVDVANRFATDVLGLVGNNGSRDPKMFSELLEPTENAIQSYKNKDENVVGVKTGYIDLDRKLGYLQPGQLIILAAGTSQGKSTLALNIADNVAQQGHQVLFESLEMTQTELAIRILCSKALINSEDIYGGSLSKADEDSIIKAGAEFANMPLAIHDPDKLTISNLYALALRYKNQHGLRLLIVDYLQFITHAWAENQNLRVAGTTRALKQLAKAVNVPVIVLSQLSRIGSAEPQLNNLRDSGAIEQDADRVIFIYRPEFHNIPYYHFGDDAVATHNLAVINIAKARGGSTGRIKMTFQKEYTRFLDYKPEEKYQEYSRGDVEVENMF